MSEKEVFLYLRNVGCCDGCCLRFMAVRHPNAYENTNTYIEQANLVSGGTGATTTAPGEPESSANGAPDHTNGDSSEEPPPAKRRKWQVCVCCVGVLQRETWDQCVERVTEMLNKKKYVCDTYACALSAPIATMMREKSVTCSLDDKFPEYSANRPLTPLKEAWKWSFGPYLSQKVNKVLDSGAISPLLVTINMEYPDDLEELEHLKAMTPSLFESRGKQRRRFAVEFTRRSVEQSLAGATRAALAEHWHCPPERPRAAAACVSVACNHAPVYLGGRYVKLSRELPQTPWVLNGKRMMESSVQEIIFQPIAECFNISECDVDHRVKFISAGREDVDVRCLGSGRPFAVEVSDPSVLPTEEQLTEICDKIARSGKVMVPVLKLVDKDDLTELKKGEQTKTKVYEALCIKLSHSESDSADKPIAVTEADINNINTYTNVEDGSCRVLLEQRTPIRVLHRRPLLTRERRILELSARTVPEHPRLFVVRLRTGAGTYVKEWVHGELARTSPSLSAALRGSRADILALDVRGVDLQWPR